MTVTWRYLAPLVCTLGPTLCRGQGTLGSWVEAESALAEPACRTVDSRRCP